MVSASPATTSSPDSQTPVSASLRWVTTSVKRSNWDRTSLNCSRMTVKWRCCSAGEAVRPGPRSHARNSRIRRRRASRPRTRKPSMSSCAFGDRAAAGTIVSCSANGLTRSSRGSSAPASCSMSREAGACRGGGTSATVAVAMSDPEDHDLVTATDPPAALPPALGRHAIVLVALGAVAAIAAVGAVGAVAAAVAAVGVRGRVRGGPDPCVVAVRVARPGTARTARAPRARRTGRPLLARHLTAAGRPTGPLVRRTPDQARRVPARGRHHSRPGDGLGRRGPRSERRVLRRAAREPPEPAWDLDLGLLLGHALELHLEQVRGSRAELGADRGADPRSHERAESAAHDGQGLLGDVLEDAAQGLARARLDEAPDAGCHLLEEVAEELLELGLALDLQQLRGRFKLLGLAQRPLGLAGETAQH